MLSQDKPTQNSKKTATNQQTRYSLNDIKKMVGFTDSSDNTQKEEDVANTTKVSAQGKAESLIDPNDFPKSEASKRKPWQNGWAKLGMIGVPLGFASLLVGVILVNVTSIKLSGEPEQSETVVSTEEEDTAALEAQRQEAEIANLKTANALGNQASVLDNQPRRTEIRPQPPETTSSEPTTTSESKAEAPRPAPATVVASPSQVRSRPVAVSRPPAIPRSPTAPTRVSVPSTPTLNTVPRVVQTQDMATSAAEPVKDPFEEWQRLTALGSYGQVGGSNLPTESAVVQQPNREYETAQVEQNQIIPVMVSYGNQQASDVDTSLASYQETSRPLPNYMEETLLKPMEKASVDDSIQTTSQTEEAVADIEQDKTKITLDELRGNPGQYVADSKEYATYDAGVDFIMGQQPINELVTTEILPGISAKGEVITPVAWAGDIASTSGSIELTEALVSDNVVIMPVGTQLIVSLQEMSASGMMSLSVTSIVLPESGYEHMQIPTSAISIQGKKGQLLMAREISGTDRELQRLNLNQAFLGALGQVGAILNRPNSSISTVTAGGATSSTDYGSPNILGAILEGSANTIISQRAERNQARAESLEDRPPVWVLENGTDIEIFVNQRVAL